LLPILGGIGGVIILVLIFGNILHVGNNQAAAFVTKWGSSGNYSGQFDGPIGVAVDSPSGNVYVADEGNNRIQKFISNGTFITESGSNGNSSGQFINPHGVTVDSSGNVYVADFWNNRIQVFASANHNN
jgi:tripartite motif-containing protein 71